MQEATARARFGAQPGSWGDAARQATVSGAIAAVATSAVVAAAGARESGSALAPINATSHIAWGEAAGRVESFDARHTLLGAALNLGACIFWATFYERWFGSASRHGGRAGTAVLGGAAVAAAAYVTDYHLVPERLTPGWELRLSGRGIAAAYLALALSLPLGVLLQRRK